MFLFLFWIGFNKVCQKIRKEFKCLLLFGYCYSQAVRTKYFTNLAICKLPIQQQKSIKQQNHKQCEVQNHKSVKYKIISSCIYQNDSYQPSISIDFHYYLAIESIKRINLMGCGLSHTYRPVNMRINILDSEFLRKENSKVRDKMDKLHINYETYVSMQKMLQHMLLEYRNVIITTQHFLQQLQKQLTLVKLSPNIFVRSTSKKLSNPKLTTNTFNVQYFHSYEELIQELMSRTVDRENVVGNKGVERENSDGLKKHVVVKILREESGETEMELRMVKEALKVRGISYQIYNTFAAYIQSLTTTTSTFTITQHPYHRQLLNLLPPTSPTHIICLTPFTRHQTYDPRLYSITDNWLQIINDISIEQKWSHLNFVKCSRVFMYAQNEKSLAHYAETIEGMGFDVRIYGDLGKIVAESRGYFAVTVVVRGEDYGLVESYLRKNDFWFKTKLITIPKQTSSNSIKSLHKILKQLKRGYRGQKSTTRSIDIIDKHLATNTKSSSIRQQFSTHNIITSIYSNIDEYISNLKYISPYIIVTEQQSTLLLRYLKEMRASSKVVLFCHRSNSGGIGEVKNQHAFCLITDNFGRVVEFVKSNPVYNPVIPDIKRWLENRNQDDDFDKVDPSEIQQQDLQRYKITKYTTTEFRKSRR